MKVVKTINTNYTENLHNTNFAFNYNKIIYKILSLTIKKEKSEYKKKENTVKPVYYYYVHAYKYCLV